MLNEATRKMKAVQVENMGIRLMEYCRDHGVLPKGTTDEDLEQVLRSEGLYNTLWDGLVWHLKNRKKQLAVVLKKKLEAAKD